MIFVVAIDGPAAAGKGTIARQIAFRFGFDHLDTGLLYRAVGLKAMEIGRGVIDTKVAVRVAGNLSAADLSRSDLRNARVAQAASRVAAEEEVREALIEFQRSFAMREGGVVLDGRDIGTVICPDADVKLFVTASDAVRANRRFAELTDKGAKTTLERVEIDLRQRDLRDKSRETAPLSRAEDAVLLDTTELSIDAAVTEAVAVIEQRLKSRT